MQSSRSSSTFRKTEKKFESFIPTPTATPAHHLSTTTTPCTNVVKPSLSLTYTHSLTHTFTADVIPSGVIARCVQYESCYSKWFLFMICNSYRNLSTVIFFKTAELFDNFVKKIFGFFRPPLFISSEFETKKKINIFFYRVSVI